jgi:hypothetical protein
MSSTAILSWDYPAAATFAKGVKDRPAAVKTDRRVWTENVVSASTYEFLVLASASSAPLDAGSTCVMPIKGITDCWPLRVGELPNEVLGAIRSAEMDSKYDYLNALLED